MALNLRIAAKKLCPYFQAHQITVLTNQPLWVTLHKLNLSSRMVNWAIKLSEYYIWIGLTQIEQVVCLNFPVSNIEAKYEAILMGQSSFNSHNHEKKLHGSCANMSHTRRCLGTMIDGGEHPTMPLILAIEFS
ncbi:hypothetical protein AAG906_026013 [Vitis piasezkii]